MLTQRTPRVLDTHHLLLRGNRIGIGVYDAFSALIASQYRFDFLWVSSFALSASKGIPDAGLLDAGETLSIVQSILSATYLPVVVDLDSGYGNSLKLFQTVKAMAAAGVNAVCIEDNPLSKRCSLYDDYDRLLVSPEEHIERIQACRLAIDEVQSPCSVIARTEALVAGLGVNEALRRAHAYAAHGANALFVQSVDPNGEDVLEFCSQLQVKIPVFLAPTRFPHIANETLFSNGATHIIFANQGIRAAHAALCETFSQLEVSNCSAPVEPKISPVAEISRLVGEPRVRELDSLLTRHTSLV